MRSLMLKICILLTLFSIFTASLRLNIVKNNKIYSKFSSQLFSKQNKRYHDNENKKKQQSKYKSFYNNSNSLSSISSSPLQKNELEEFLLSEKKEIKRSKGMDILEYSSEYFCGGHIVDEEFEYIKKDYESNEIVQYMQNRQELRAKKGMKKIDKKNNPLIAISGSPGIGKSTFLCHFPESLEYQKYVFDKFGKSPIVSTLSFNSAMSDRPDFFELRIIYGAIKSMGLLSKNISWSEFVMRFKNIRLSYSDTMNLLHETFGKDRPVLILVDELSKSEDDEKVSLTLGQLLDCYDNCDVVVSSLSPSYVKTLFLGSQRLVNDAIVYPLLNTELGKKNCEIWTNSLLNKVDPTIVVDSFKVNLLRNIYLLFSGHPRSIESMKNGLENKHFDWSEVIENLNNPKMKFGKLLKIISDEMSEFSPSLIGLDNSILEDFIFRYPSKRYAEDVEFRMLVETGKILIFNRNKDKFTTCVQAQSILLFIISSPSIEKFKNNNNNRMGIVWEKIVSFNIMMRSFEKQGFSDLFGISFDITFISSEMEDKVLDLKIIDSSRKSFKRELCYNSDNFYSPLKEDDDQSGYDGLVVLNYDNNGNKKELLHFYLQMKVQLDLTNENMIDKIISLISYNLLDYMNVFQNSDNITNYNNIHMILYVWESKQENFEKLFSKDEFTISEYTRNVIDYQFEKIMRKFKNLPNGFNKEMITNYITNNWNQIHFVGQEKLQSWLCPSFLPFPMIATALNDNYNES